VFAHNGLVGGSSPPGPTIFVHIIFWGIDDEATPALPVWIPTDPASWAIAHRGRHLHRRQSNEV
jgi:hypothetical protein